MAHKHANRLINETSPYLLQHAHNPVDWYPWGAEALERAARERKPILLSIGYSACHWCHVMERECFEDEGIASLMNEHFVNIKVDREERPDLDEIYQAAAQLLTGQGGWPLTVFLTPDQRPFFAGTYFPPDDRYGRPGFRRILATLARAYAEEPERIERAAQQLTAAVRMVDNRSIDARAPVAPAEGADLLEKAAAWLSRQFDEENGGFGTRPKFPNTTTLEVFLRYGARTGEGEYLERVRFTLRKMAEGGIYDQLGGGFHRYSTDERWLVPHFEKMLYDNALLPPLYVQAHQVSSDPLFERVARETLAYVEREMSHPEGGFYTAQDADSEGEEGKFFVWRPEEVEQVVGEDAPLVCAYFGVTPAGNFEKGTSVLHVARPMEEVAREHGLPLEEAAGRIERARRSLFEARERRVKPLRDEKVIAGWAALMTSAFAKAARPLGEPRYLERARRAAEFIEARLVKGTRLVRSFKGRPSPHPGFLDDYVFWVQALLDLYEASFERAFLDRAKLWMDRAIELFWDEASPGFFLTPKDHESLVHRPKDWRDESMPSGTGVALQNLLRLHSAFDREGYLDKAEAVLETYRRQLDQNPWGTASMLLAYDALVHGPTEVVIAARPDQLEEAQRLAAEVAKGYLPQLVLHCIDPAEGEGEGAPELWRGKGQREGEATAYVCRGFACSEPFTQPEKLREYLVREAFAPGEQPS